MEDNATIVVDVQLTPKDLQDLWRGSPMTFLGWLLAACGAYLAYVAFAEIMNEGFSAETAFTVLWNSVVALGAFFVAIFITRLRSWQLIRHGPTLRERRQYAFSDRGVHFDSELMTCELKWGSFSRIIENPRTFVLYLAPLAGMVIPKKHLNKHDDLQRLRELFRNHFKGKLKLRA
jgi:YcxB-like protein